MFPPLLWTKRGGPGKVTPNRGGELMIHDRASSRVWKFHTCSSFITPRLHPGTSPRSKQRFPRSQSSHRGIATRSLLATAGEVFLHRSSPVLANPWDTRAAKSSGPLCPASAQEDGREASRRGLLSSQREIYKMSYREGGTAPSLGRRCKQLSSLLKTLPGGSRDGKE